MPHFVYTQHKRKSCGAAALLHVAAELDYGILTDLGPHATALLKARFPMGIHVENTLAAAQHALTQWLPNERLQLFPHAAQIRAVIDHISKRDELTSCSPFDHTSPLAALTPAETQYYLYLCWYLEEAIFEATKHNKEGLPCPTGGSWPSAMCAIARLMGFFSSRIYVFKTPRIEQLLQSYPQELDACQKLGATFLPANAKIALPSSNPMANRRVIKLFHGDHWIVERPDGTIMDPSPIANTINPIYYGAHFPAGNSTDITNEEIIIIIETPILEKLSNAVYL